MLVAVPGLWCVQLGAARGDSAPHSLDARGADRAVTRPVLLTNRSLILLTAAAFLLADAVIVLVIGPADFAFDFTCCYQQAAGRLLEDPSTL